MPRCGRFQNDRTLLEGCAHSQRAGEGQWRLLENPALALAFGAIKGRSPALDEADDRAAASARLARAAIDAPVLREIAEVAFGAEEIAQGRAARGDRRRQHVLDRGHERSEEHTSELQSLMRTSYAVFCLKKNNSNPKNIMNPQHETPSH